MTGLRAKNFSWVSTWASQNGVNKVRRTSDGMASLPTRSSRPLPAGAHYAKTIPHRVADQGRLHDLTFAAENVGRLASGVYDFLRLCARRALSAPAKAAGGRCQIARVARNEAISLAA